MKRTVSLLLALILICVLFPLPSASAAEMKVETIVEPKYEAVQNFSGGYAAVRKDGKWGYIDETGKVVINFKYDWAGFFSEGVAAVAVKEKTGFGTYMVFHLINDKGMDVVLKNSMNTWSTEFQGIYDFCPNYMYDYEGVLEEINKKAIHWICHDGVINVNNALYTTGGKEILIKESEKSKLFLPTWGEFEDPFEYFYPSGPCVDGVIPMIATHVGQSQYQQSFYMDKQGKVLRTFKVCDWENGKGGFSNAMAPNKGVSLVTVLYEPYEDYFMRWHVRYGLLDANDNWVLEPKYTNFFYLFNGDFLVNDLLALENESGLWGAVNSKGKTVIPFRYKSMTAFGNGYSCAKKQDGTYVYLDTAGKEYKIGGLNGGIANATLCTSAGDGLAAVYDATLGKAYCVSTKPVNGVFPAIKGSDLLDISVYLPNHGDEDAAQVIYAPSEIIIIEENGRYGFARITVEEETEESVTRVFGSDRYATSFKAADTLKAQLGVKKFQNIVVASGTGFADALAGSYLAAVKNAPILLVRGANVNDVKTYIKNNLTAGGTVYLLGGVNAVPKTMESGLDGFSVKRLGGANRYDTNLLILQEAGVGGKDIIVCTGLNFADSLSASATGLPILLVKDGLYANQKEFLKNNGGNFIIVGGTGAVNATVEKQLKSYGSVKRLAGNTRYDTSVLVAKEFFDAPNSAVLAYAQNFPDGLSGGPLAYAVKAPLILTDNNKPTAAVAYATGLGIKNGYVLGGTGLISDKVVKNIFSMASGASILVK